MLGVDRELKDAVPYAAPFVTWIALQMLLPATAPSYAVRAGATNAALFHTYRYLRDNL